MDMTFLNVLLPMMFEGLKLTILIAVVGITIGFLIGSLCGYLLQSKYKIGKAIAEVYIWKDFLLAEHRKVCYTKRTQNKSLWKFFYRYL